jgi:hypothetical protein
MKMEMTIRRAIPADAEMLTQLAAILKSVWRQVMCRWTQ